MITRRSLLLAIGVAALLGVLFFELLSVNLKTSMSWDEGHHLFDGYTILRHHDFALNPEVPPFAKVVAALPLLPLPLYEPLQQGRSSQLEAYIDGRDFLFKNNADQLLLRSRMAVSGFTLILALLVFLAGQEMFDTQTGLLALSLLVLDPNLLAHGALVTTDAAITCLVFASVYTWRRFTLQPSVWRLFLTAMLVGLAFATKFTGLFLVPTLVVLMIAEAFQQRNLRLLAERGAALSMIFCGAYIVLWGCYGFRYAARPDGLVQNPTLASYLHEYAQVGDPRSLQILARWHALPEAFLWGLANTKLTEERNLSYLFGVIHRHGSWLYFPAAIAIKSTLPFLAILVVAVYVLFRTPALRAQWLTLMVPVTVFLGFAMHSDMNIGIRHILPIYPFLYLAGSSAVVWLVRRHRGMAAGVIVLIAFQGITSLRSFPGYLAYANEAWGGSNNVHRFLSDSNSDWGQQLKTAAEYLHNRHISDCWMAYTASGVVDERYYGIPCRPLPTSVNLWWIPIPMEVPPKIKGIVLISDNELEGINLPFRQPSPYARFRSLKPVAVLDGGLFVYEGEFNVSLASKMTALARSNAAR